jgi:two-component system LytT family response regulator
VKTDVTIRAIVVDDEPLARSNVITLLRRDPEIEIIRECASGMEALAAIRGEKPDLVFLDVQMPECDGFDVLEQLGGDQTFEIVFVTAYDRYALDAFEAGALDYLLKPFDDDRFERMLRRVKGRIADRQHAPRTVGCLAVKSPGHLLFIKIAEIDWIEAADYYAAVHVGPKSHLLRRSINSLEHDLDPAVFCRIHRSTIVNLSRVRGLELNEEGEHDARLDNGTRLRVSRRYRGELQSRLIQ